MGAEPKKLALLRIWQILHENSDAYHPLTQEIISHHLRNDYGIEIERKAISRNIQLLKESGIDIKSGRAGSYLATRDFEDSELRMLIDGVLCSKYITVAHSKDLINRLCGLTNRYFKSHVKNICSVNDWSKTDNQNLFYNIEIIDEAINKDKQIDYDYNKYDIDLKLKKSSHQKTSPYQLILRNQKYYLMGYSEYWSNMIFHRLEKITNIRMLDKSSVPLRTIPGYKNGIDYKRIASNMPYMYTDEPESVEFIADMEIVDQIVDWFGKDIYMEEFKNDGSKVYVVIKASPKAMKYWIMQYSNYVEILKPSSLRREIKNDLEKAIKKYSLHDDI